MNCTYTTTIGHSTQVGVGTDTAGTPLYGQYEDYPTLPSLDACGGHFGFTPDSPTVSVYHNHVQEKPPYTFGCYGPSSTNALVTVAECRSINAAFCGTDSSSVSTVTVGTASYSYDNYCPCFDGSGNGPLGAGLNTYADTVEVAAISDAGTLWNGTLWNGAFGATDPSPPSPPPPSPAASEPSDPCFPSTASVTKADGARVTVADLEEGDAIVATTADGALTTDTVSMLSIAVPEAEAATFLTLTTAAKLNVTLTPEHHLPVGAACCSTLKRAKEVVLGETVWAVQQGTAMATTVVQMTAVIQRGLHSPVLTNGGFPVVDGVVTSFDSIDKVTLAKHGLSPLLAACKATGTCGTFRDMFLVAGRRYIA